jgi:Glycosyltransferase like family 2
MLSRLRPRGVLRRAQGLSGLELRLERLERRLDQVQGAIEAAAAAGAATAAQNAQHVAGLLHEIELRSRQTHELLDTDVRSILLAIVAEDAESRRRLWRAREDPGYELAFSQAEPLVSVVIPTYDRPELLTTRSLPSVLSQSYENIEVIVVGDHAGPEVEEAVAALGDPRLSYVNLTQRLVPHPDPHKHWMIRSTMARNEGTRLAHGHWIVSFDDDDLMYPGAIARLLGEARERRVEVAYGHLLFVLADEPSYEIGEFPPRHGEFSWQSAVWHGGLRFFEREHVAADLGQPADVYLFERMLRAGVRFAMIDELVGELHPSSQREQRPALP